MKQQIKKDMMLAMKEKNVVARDVLRVLLGEIERNEQTKHGKNELTEGEVVQLIKKMIDNLKYIGDNHEEIEVLEAYLPKQMGEDEIRHNAKEIINDNDIDTINGMGLVMTQFKRKFEGRYDARILSIIVKNLLS